MLLWLSLATMVVWLLHSQHKALDLNQEISFRDDRVWLGEHRLGLFPPLWGSAIRNLVYQSAFQQDPLESIDQEVAFASHIGITSAGQLVSQPISGKQPHAILIGPTGSGKTELMRLIAFHYQAEIWAIDFKGGDGFSEFPGLTRLVTDSNLSELEAIAQAIELRQQQPANPKALLVVDELGEALREPRVSRLVEQVAAKGRSLNVMLIAANQTLSQIPRTIWVNCANRLSVAADLVDRSQLGFAGKPAGPVGQLHTAELFQAGRQISFGFPVGVVFDREITHELGATNPLLSRVSPRLQ